MLPLRARRVGLLTPFMGILGVIAGALSCSAASSPGWPRSCRPSGWRARRALPRALARRARPRLGDRRGRSLADGRAPPRTSSDAWRGAGTNARPHAARAGTGAAATEVWQAAPQALAQPGARRGPPASNEHEHDEPHGGGREDHELITGSLREEPAGERAEQVADDPESRTRRPSRSRSAPPAPPRRAVRASPCSRGRSPHRPAEGRRSRAGRSQPSPPARSRPPPAAPRRTRAAAVACHRLPRRWRRRRSTPPRTALRSGPG